MSSGGSGSGAAGGPDVRLALVPDLTVTSLALDAHLGQTGAIPEPVRLRLLTAIRTRAGRDALRPILVQSRGGRRQMPTAVAPVTPTGDLPLETQVEALRANHGDRLRDDLAEIYPDRLPDAWRVAADNPARWSRALADLTDDVWGSVGRAAWRRADPLLDAEYRRVGQSLARGDRLALLNSLSPRIAFADGVLVLDGRVRVPVVGRQVVLAPMVAAPGAIVVERDHPTALVIGYALTRAGQVWEGTVTAPPLAAEDPLATVMGRSRAHLLRHLDRRATMTDLAAELGLAPSTLTHHCAALESAGLVSRQRDGKTVLVWRTERGAELVDLFR